MKDERKMKYHIVITDNETGETLKEADACAIIGAYCDDRGVGDMTSLCCDAVELALTLSTAEKVIHKIKEDHPELVPLQALLALTMDSDDEDEETEDK